VQHGGVEALDDVLQFATNLDKSDLRNEQFAGNLFKEAAEKLLWKADNARSVDQACEVVVKLTQYGQDPTDVTMSALQRYRWYNMPDKLKLLNNITTSVQAADLNLPSLRFFVLGTMNGAGDRAAVLEWMNQHPDSPLVPIIEKRVPRSQ